MTTRYWYWLWKTFLGPSRLRRKFVRTFLISGLVPLILMGLVSYYLVNITHSLDVLTVEDNLALQVSNEVQNIFTVAKTNFDLKVNFGEFAPIAFNEQDFVLKGLLKDIPQLSEISFICITGEACEAGHETSRFIKTSGGEETAPLRDRSQDPAFLSAKSGESYVGTTQFTEGFTRAPIAGSVLNANNQIVEVLAGEIDLKTAIQPLVKNAKLGTTGYVYTISRSGKIIAHPDELQIGKMAQDIPFLDLTSEANSGKNSSYTSLTGTSVSGAAHLIPEIDVIMIAEWPQAETQSLIRTILLQIGGFSLLAFLILFVIASWVALKLIQPIAELRQGTSVIGAGNFNYRVQIKTGDELEDLGTNLNKMAGNLKGLEELRELKLRTDLLSESLRKEQELSKLKDQFITTVSHQFNTPLTAINWSLAAFEDSSMNKEKIQEAVHIITKSQKDIVAIVTDLVTLSEVGFEYKKSRVTQVDIGATIEKILDFFNGVI